jgi:hypothetical protein
MEDICEAAWQTHLAKPRDKQWVALTPEDVLQTLMATKEVSSPDQLCITIGNNPDMLVRKVCT